MCIFAIGTCISATAHFSSGWLQRHHRRQGCPNDCAGDCDHGLRGVAGRGIAQLRHHRAPFPLHRHRALAVVGHLLRGLSPTQCTLTLTKRGDLQLLALFKGTNTMVWHSNTAWQGHHADSDHFQLLDVGSMTVWGSFNVPEFAIAPTKKFR